MLSYLQYHFVCLKTYQMETLSTLLAICAWNSPNKGQWGTGSFDVFFDLRWNEWFRKQPWGWWFEMPLHPLWRHSNVVTFRFEIHGLHIIMIIISIFLIYPSICLTYANCWSKYVNTRYILLSGTRAMLYVWVVVVMFIVGLLHYSQ